MLTPLGSKRWRVILSILFVWALGVGSGLAHVGFHGITTVQLFPARTELVFLIIPENVGMLLPGRPPLSNTVEERAQLLEFFREQASRYFELTTSSGSLPPQKTNVSRDAGGAYVVVIDFQAVDPPFQIRAVIATEVENDFQIPISVFDRRMESSGKSLPFAGGILSGNYPVLNVPSVVAGPPPVEKTLPSPPSTFRQYFVLGVEHILTGYDHLLFLLALLVTCDRLKTTLGIITAFTIAHSLTLALSVFNLIQVSGKIVEPLIAASIVYVGLLDLWGRSETKSRVRLAFGFGLIHGLGFAGVLREIGLGAGGAPVALPLFAFNLGVEAGQIAVAGLVLPIFWMLRKVQSIRSYVVPIVSSLVIVAGSFWLVERLWP